MQPHAGIARARWSWKKKVLLQLALLPVWLLTAEMLFRGALWIGGKPYHAEAARNVIVTQLTALTSVAPLVRREDAHIDPATLGFYRSWHAHPYYGFETAAIPAQIEAELSHPRDPNDYTICVLGGSVAWMFTPEGTDALSKDLSADPRFAGRTIRFLNVAQPAYKQPQQLMQFAYLLELGIKPDALISMDGFNEAGFGWGNIQEHVNPAYPDLAIFGHQVHSSTDDRTGLGYLLDIRDMQRQVQAIGDFALEYQLYESSLLGRMTLARLEWRTARASYKRAQYVATLSGDAALDDLRGPKVAGGHAAAVNAAVRAWVEASRSLQDLCRGRSIYYLHVLQPTLLDTGSKPLTAAEISTQGNNAYFTNGVHAIYPLLRKEGEALRAEGVNFYDCSMAFATLHESVYFDHCHFKGLGNEIVAARIAEAFLKNLPAPEVAATTRKSR